VRWEFVKTFHTPSTAQNDAVVFAPRAGGNQLLLTSTSKAVTPFAGLCSFIAWLRQIDFLDQTTRALPFSYVSPNAIPIADTFTAFLLSVVVGAPRFAHCDWLRFDSALHTLLGFKRFPGDDAILRFFVRFTQDYVEARSFAPVSAGWRLRCLPADSGFFDQALLAMLEAHAVPYIIVARLTTARKRRLHSSALVWRDLGKGYAVSSFTLKAVWLERHAPLRRPARAGTRGQERGGPSAHRRAWLHLPRVGHQPHRGRRHALARLQRAGNHRTAHRRTEERHARRRVLHTQVLRDRGGDALRPLRV
jgi:hypothetical protein